jgi:cobalt-zinc-cadmium efflux system membrane fusion protein
MSAATILIVDDDEVLGQILTRVLTQQGYQVERATDAAQAVQLAREHPPQLGLLDLSLPDQDAVELGRKLRGQAPGLPLILMTAYPLSLRDQPERIEGFARVLTKPLNLQELRRAVDAALGNGAGAAAGTGEAPGPVAREPEASPQPEAAGPAAERETGSRTPRPRPPARRRWLAWVAAAVAAVVLLAVGAAVGSRFLGQSQGGPAEEGERPAAGGVKLVEGSRDILLVPADVARALGLQTAVARQATEAQPLELSGSLNLDPSRLVRVHARFGGEVVEIGKVEEGSGAFATAPRDIRFGDKLKKDQLLCVVWSKELGVQKSDLVDALSQLRTDQETLDRYEKLYKEGAIPEGQLRQQRRAVESGLNAVSRAERTLRVWRVPEDEIQAVRDEAEKIRQRGGKRDPEKERNWARVEVRAPFAGLVVEMNVSFGDIVDTSTDLFKVANMDVLTVWAHAYEEDLPALRALPKDERRWTVRITSDPTAPPVPGTIDNIGRIVDPNQHTALVTGRIQNPGDELRAGQFVTATVELPPPPQVVAVPIGALVEDGEQSVVFARPDPKKDEYRMRQVLVVQRRRDVAYVRWMRPDWVLLTGWAPPAAPLNPAVGTLSDLPLVEREVTVVTSGALLLKSALDDLQNGKP